MSGKRFAVFEFSGLLPLFVSLATLLFACYAHDTLPAIGAVALMVANWIVFGHIGRVASRDEGSGIA